MTSNFSLSSSLLCFALNNKSARKVARSSLKSSLKRKPMIRYRYCINKMAGSVLSIFTFSFQITVSQDVSYMTKRNLCWQAVFHVTFKVRESMKNFEGSIGMVFSLNLLKFTIHFVGSGRPAFSGF